MGSAKRSGRVVRRSPRWAALLLVGAAGACGAVGGVRADVESVDLGPRWTAGMCAVLSGWRFSCEETWLGEHAPVQKSVLLHVEEHLQCLAALEGRLTAARATYRASWVMSWDMDAELHGVTVDFRADATGAIRWHVADARELSAAARQLLDGRAERLDPFRSRLTDLPLATHEPSARPRALESLAGLLGIGGYEAASSNLDVRSGMDGEMPSWSARGRLAGVSRSPLPTGAKAAWDAGGDLEFGAGLRAAPTGSAPRLEGWAAGQLYGQFTRDGKRLAVVRSDYVDVSVRLVAPESPQAAAPEVASPESLRAALAAQGIALIPVEARLLDGEGEWRCLAVERPDGSTLAPAWIAAPDRALRRMGESAADEGQPPSWTPLGRGVVGLRSARSAPTAPVPPLQAKVPPTPVVGETCWALLPDKLGGTIARRLRFGRLSTEARSDAPIVAGLSHADAHCGAWLLVASGGEIRGWTRPSTFTDVRDLIRPTPGTPEEADPGPTAFVSWAYAPSHLPQYWAPVAPPTSGALPESTRLGPDPGPAGWLDVARTALARANPVAALGALAELRSRHPTYAALLDALRPVLARQAEHLRDFEFDARLTARVQLDVALLHLPACAETLRLARLLESQGDADRAQALARACVGSEDVGQDALEHAARLLQSMGRNEELLTLLEHEPQPLTSTALTAMHHDALWALNRQAEARVVLEEVPDAQRDDLILERLVQALVAASELDRAREAAHAWQRLSPRDPRAHYALGYVESLLKHWASALVAAQSGLAFAPRHALLLELAARGSALLDRRDEAERYLKRLAQEDILREALVRAELWGREPGK